MSTVRVPGSVYLRESGRWIALSPSVFDPEKGKRRRITIGHFDTREQAEEALRGFHQSSGSHQVSRQRLSVYLDGWLDLVRSQVDVGHLARRTAKGYEEAVRLHIRPALGHLRTMDLHHLVIHDWLNSLRRVKGLSDQTVVRLYRTLHRAMADAPLDRNPAALPKHMRPTVRSRREIVRPTHNEIGEFLTHTKNCEQSTYLHPLFRLAAVSGMRRGELLGLAWSDIDFEQGLLNVARSLGIVATEAFLKEPKSDAGKRVVGLDPTTLAILRVHKQRLMEDKLRAFRDYVELPLGLDLIFRAGDDGRLVRPDVASQSFTKEWQHARLRQGVTLHSLRHSMASMLVADGFPLTQVAGRMGHSVEVLQRTYARDLDPKNREERMVAAISARFETVG